MPHRGPCPKPPLAQVGLKGPKTADIAVENGATALRKPAATARSGRLRRLRGGGGRGCWPRAWGGGARGARRGGESGGGRRVRGGSGACGAGRSGAADGGHGGR